MSKKKTKKKIHPYTEESLSKKEAQLKVLLSLIEVSILVPVMDVVVNIINIEFNKDLLLLLLYILLLLLSYSVKRKSKRYNFSKWEFLDDEVNIVSDRKLDGEVKDVFVNKFTVLIAINIILIMPLSLTFSTILASAISLIFSLFLDDIFVNLIKFLLIAIIFKNFFKSSNEILVKYLDK